MLDEIIRPYLSPDGYYLIDVGDEQRVETVAKIDPLKLQSRIEVSCQIGCPLSCPFCDYSTFYFGDLTAEEIVRQVDVVADDMKNMWELSSICVAFCRMGEPLLNEEVPKAIELLEERYPGKLSFEVQTVFPRKASRIMHAICKLQESIDIKFRISLAPSTSDWIRKKAIGTEPFSMREIGDISKSKIIKNLYIDVKWNCIDAFRDTVATYFRPLSAEFIIGKLSKSLSLEIDPSFEIDERLFDINLEMFKHTLVNLRLNKEEDAIKYAYSPGHVFSLWYRQTVVEALERFTVLEMSRSNTDEKT